MMAPSFRPPSVDGLQNPPLELSKYQTLPGKRSRKSELRPELNGEGGGEYLSPVQLSPIRSREQDYTLSEWPFAINWKIQLCFFCSDVESCVLLKSLTSNL